MHFTKTYLSLLLLLILFTFSAKAQKTAGADGLVSAKVIDAATNQPVEFATVVLLKKADNLPYKSIQTNLDGVFKLDGIAYGKYFLRITSVGYANLVKDSITIGAAHKAYAFGTLKMRTSKNSLLKEVVVTAEKNNIELGIDRKVFNVASSLISEGGSATDLLSNVPSVQVDVMVM